MPDLSDKEIIDQYQATQRNIQRVRETYIELKAYLSNGSSKYVSKDNNTLVQKCRDLLKTKDNVIEVSKMDLEEISKLLLAKLSKMKTDLTQSDLGKKYKDALNRLHVVESKRQLRAENYRAVGMQLSSQQADVDQKLKDFISAKKYFDKIKTKFKESHPDYKEAASKFKTVKDDFEKTQKQRNATQKAVTNLENTVAKTPSTFTPSASHEAHKAIGPRLRNEARAKTQSPSTKPKKR